MPEFKTISDQVSYPDGGLSFTIETKDGESLNIKLSKDDTTQLVQYLIQLSTEVAKERTNEKPTPFGQQSNVTDYGNDITSVGFGAVPELDSRVLLILHIYDFMLTFGMPKKTVKALVQAGQAYLANDSNPQ